MKPSEWLQQIQDAKDIHYRDERIETWRMAAQYYRSGAYAPRKDIPHEYAPEDTSIHINVTQAIVENFIAALLPDAFKASVLPKRPGDEESARAVQDLFNFQLIPDTGLEEEVFKAVLHASIFGDGFLKLGYTAFPKQREGEDEFLAAGQHAIQLGGDMEFDDESVYRPDLVWFKAIFPWNIIPAPGSYGLTDAPWVAHRIRKRFDDVIKNNNYDGRARGKLTPITDDQREEDHPFADSERLTIREEGDEAQGPDYIDLYEIWDLHNQEFLVIAAGNPDLYLKQSKWPFPGLEGYPFEQIGFKPDPESFYHNSMIGDFADLQEELNVVSGLMNESLKRSTPFILYDKNAIDDREAEMIANADVYGIVGVNVNSGDPIDRAIGQFPKGPSFSPDLYGVRNAIIQAILLVTGQADFLIGQSQKTKSATEVAASAQGHTARVRLKRRMFQRFFRNVLRKAYQITRHRMTRDQWVRTVGAEGANMALVTPADVRKELDVDIDAEIMEDRAADPVRMKIVTDAMAPLLNPQLMMVAGLNPVEMIKEYLRAVGVKNTDKLQPVSAKPKDPEVENLAMSEGMRMEPHPLDDDEAHMRTHIQGQGAAPEGVHIIFQEHIRKHMENLQLKQQAMVQQVAQAAQGPTTGANESPSRTSSASDNGNTAARIMQAGNN